MQATIDHWQAQEKERCNLHQQNGVAVSSERITILHTGPLNHSQRMETFAC